MSNSTTRQVDLVIVGLALGFARGPLPTAPDARGLA